MDGYRDQIVTHDVGVSLHSKTHPLFMKYSNGTSTQCYAYHYNLYIYIQSVGLCTQYANEMCAPFSTSPNCSTDFSPETGKSPICMFLHTI